MAQEHVRLYDNKDRNFLQIYVNGLLAGSIRPDMPNSDDLLEWLFEVVYLHGVESGRATLRRELNDLLQGNRGSGVSIPDRPRHDLSEFKDWPSIKASEIYSQLNKEIRTKDNHAT